MKCLRCLKTVHEDNSYKPNISNEYLKHLSNWIICLMCKELEDEVRQERPPHDDIKDALANAIEIAIIPRAKKPISKERKVIYNTRWGGVQA